MNDPRFAERIKAVQRELDFAGRDVDAIIGHNTLSRIEDRIGLRAPWPTMRMSDPRFRERILIVQRAVGFTGREVDGIIGHNTLSRIEAKILPGAAHDITTPVADEGTASGGAEAASEGDQSGPSGLVAAAGVDERSARNIATLLPQVRRLFERITVEGTRIAQSMGATGYVMISGNRTYAEQNALYAQGRTTPGRVVTNARAGYSKHNFGIAGDFGVFADGAYLDNDNPALASRIHKAVAAWVKANLPQIAWGGDWPSFRDEPHYEVKTGLTMAQMRERVAAGRSVLG